MTQYRLKWVHCMLISALLCIADTGSAQPAGEAGKWNGSFAAIAEIDIRIHDTYPGGPDWKALARALIDLEPGDTVSSDRLEEIERALAPLAQVQTDTALRPDGLQLIFQLTPHGRIKTIDMDGNYPLFEREVRNAMTVAAGDVFRTADMPEQRALIIQHYRDEGYIDPQVHIDWKREPKDGHYDLQVKIDKGAYYALDEVRLKGNQSIGDAALKARMAIWRRALFGLRATRITKQRLEQDVRRLTGYYRAQGYADVVIEADTTARGPRDRRVTCELHIQEGPRYIIHLEGNRFFSDRKLSRDLVLFEVGNRGNIGLRRSVNQIRRRYLQAGFAEVRVRWRESPPAQDSQALREISIEIEEGRRHIVEEVRIQGNDRFDEKTIRGQMLTRVPGVLRKGAYLSEVLQEDVAAIQALYHNEGFLNVRVSENVSVDPQSAKVTVAIQIAEGPQTRVAEISLAGDLPVPEARLRQDFQLKSGEPYVPFALQEDEEALAARISPLGYPHVEVAGEARLSGDRRQADIRYSVAPGPHVQVGQLFVVGNFKTRPGFMRREMGLETGDDFALQEILEGQRKLRNLDIFESVQVHSIGLKEKQDTVHLLVRAVEKEPYYFLAGGGYQSDKGFYGRTRLGDHNFTGTAKDIWLSAALSQVDYRADAGISEPRLFGSSIRADTAVFIERNEQFNQDFGTDVLGIRLNFSRAWGPHVSTGLGLRYERREQFIREETTATTAADPEALEPRSIVVATPAVLFDNRASFIRPRRGQLISAAVDISKGLDNTLDDFFKYRIEARSYYTRFERITLAGRVWVGYLQPYGGDEPPLDQLFFLGGTSTVRGFEENLLRFDAEGNPIGGRLAIAAGIEARIDIGRNFELI
ncbi:MAG: hypothetical protein C4519_27875, partial [Desulfobacteraceae bacterium]